MGLRHSLGLLLLSLPSGEHWGWARGAWWHRCPRWGMWVELLGAQGGAALGPPPKAMSWGRLSPAGQGWLQPALVMEGHEARPHSQPYHPVWGGPCLWGCPAKPTLGAGSCPLSPAWAQGAEWLRGLVGAPPGCGQHQALPSGHLVPRGRQEAVGTVVLGLHGRGAATQTLPIQAACAHPSCNREMMEHDLLLQVGLVPAAGQGLPGGCRSVASSSAREGAQGGAHSCWVLLPLHTSGRSRGSVPSPCAHGCCASSVLPPQLPAHHHGVPPGSPPTMPGGLTLSPPPACSWRGR